MQLRADADGVTVVVDGHPQSHVCLRDPGLLAFEYMQHLGLAVQMVRPPAPAPLRVTHVGGAGLTLARWVQHTRPGSTQVVLEPDAELTALVRDALPLPRGHRIRVRPVGGTEGIGALGDSSADVIILDAYAAGRVPAELTTTEWFAEAARVLDTNGLLAANLADEPGLGYAARVLASIEGADSFAETAVVAAHEVWKGRRFGNLVVVAGRHGLDIAALLRAAASAPTPTGVRHGQQLLAMGRAARALTADAPALSPVPPDPGRWRVR